MSGGWSEAGGDLVTAQDIENRLFFVVMGLKTETGGGNRKAEYKMEETEREEFNRGPLIKCPPFYFCFIKVTALLDTFTMLTKVSLNYHLFPIRSSYRHI